MHHSFSETRYYVLQSSQQQDFYGCAVAHFLTSEEAINFADTLTLEGKPVVVEEVTWQNDTHRSHSIIYNTQLKESDV